MSSFHVVVALIFVKEAQQYLQSVLSERNCVATSAFGVVQNQSQNREVAVAVAVQIVHHLVMIMRHNDCRLFREFAWH